MNKAIYKNLRGHNWLHFPIGPSVLLPWIQTIFKILTLFSIRVKKSVWVYSLRKKGDGFLLFFKAFSWETDLWVTLRDFTVKNAKLEMEIFIQLKID